MSAQLSVRDAKNGKVSGLRLYHRRIHFNLGLYLRNSQPRQILGPEEAC